MIDPTGVFRPLREALGDLVLASSEVEETLQDGIWTLGGGARRCRQVSSRHIYARAAR